MIWLNKEAYWSNELHIIFYKSCWMPLREKIVFIFEHITAVGYFMAIPRKLLSFSRNNCRIQSCFSSTTISSSESIEPFVETSGVKQSSCISTFFHQFIVPSGCQCYIYELLFKIFIHPSIPLGNKFTDIICQQLLLMGN